MSKLFSNLPEELNKYNPDKFFLGKRKNVVTFNKEGNVNTAPPLNMNPFRNYDTKVLEDFPTFDKDGLLHSFNDEPSFIRQGSGGAFLLLWHDHGVLQRGHNKPVCIVITASTYETFNEEGKPHSYNDEPAYFSKGRDGCLLVWYCNGLADRGNDLPAQVRWTKKKFRKRMFLDEQCYMSNGKRHRNDNLPAMLIGTKIKYWYVKDIAHNATGNAWVTNADNAFWRWYLYDLRMPEAAFNNFKYIEKEENLPGWAAFLVMFNMATANDVRMILDDNGNWDSKLPFIWLLRSLGITTESYFAAIVAFYDTTADEFLYISSYNANHYLDAFVNVVNTELEYNLLQTEDKESSYA